MGLPKNIWEAGGGAGKGLYRFVSGERCSEEGDKWQG